MALGKFPKTIIIILVFGLVLRLIGLSQSFWLDEASQAQMSSLPISEIWNGRSGDFHPPLYYIFAHFWMQFGRSEVWLRLPSVLFGIINIYLIYIFARKILSDKQIVIGNWKMKIENLAGILLAISPFHIYYSQEFRSYSLLCLLGTWSMYLLFTRKYFWLTIANTLLLYTHYSSVFLIITQLVYVTIYQKSDLKKFLLTLTLTFTFSLPWLPQLIKQLDSGINIDTYLPGWRQMLSVPVLRAFPLTLFKLTAGRITFLSRYLYLGYVIFDLGTVFTAMRFAPVRRNLLFTWVLTPVFLMMSFSFIFPQNQPFRVIYILPGLILIFVQAMARFPKLFTTLILYIFLVGNLAYYTRPRLQREQWRQAVQMTQDGTSVIKFSGQFAPQEWYSPGSRIIPAIPVYPAAAGQVSQVLASSLLPADREIYLFDYLGDITDPRREVDLALENLGYTRQKTYDFPGVGFIHLYIRI